MVAWAVLFSAGVNLLYLVPSLYMLQVYDRVLSTGGMSPLILLSVVVVFALAVLGLLDMTRQRLAARFGLRLSRMLGPVVTELTVNRPEGDAARGGQDRCVLPGRGRIPARYAHRG